MSSRSTAPAPARGVDISGLRARQATAQDFDDFDLILAMDAVNLGDLERLRPKGAAEPKLMLDYSPKHRGRDVPDPYFGGADGFEHVLDLLEAASEGLLDAFPPSRG